MNWPLILLVPLHRQCRKRNIGDRLHMTCHNLSSLRGFVIPVILGDSLVLYFVCSTFLVFFFGPPPLNLRAASSSIDPANCLILSFISSLLPYHILPSRLFIVLNYSRFTPQPTEGQHVRFLVHLCHRLPPHSCTATPPPSTLITQYNTPILCITAAVYDYKNRITLDAHIV